MNARIISVLIGGIVVVGLCIYLLWPSPKKAAVAQVLPVVPAPAAPSPTVVPGPATPVDMGTPGSTYFHLVALANTGPEGKKKALDEAYKAPIDFWGKVVDQDGKPIEGADAKFTINTEPDPYGNLPTEHVQSDGDGLFSLTGKRGLSLSVWVSKDGYYSTSEKSGANLNYSLKGGVNQPFPTSDNPTLFVLKKKGSPAALVHKQLQLQIPKDGAPVEVNLAQGRVTGAGQGDLKIESWVAPNGKDVAHTYPWKCQVTVTGGGLQVKTGDLDFEAPTDGYQPQEEVAMAANAPQWKRDMMREYFLQVSGGRYVRMSFWMHNGASNFVDLDYYLNPQAGDRNLESAQ